MEGGKKAIFVVFVLLVSLMPLKVSAVNEIEFTIDINPEITFEKIEVAGQYFAKIGIEGGGFTTEIGKPMLPVIRYLIETPGDCSAYLTISSISFEDTSLKEIGLPLKIYPLQPSIPKNEPREIKEIFIDENCYSTNEFLGSEIARIASAGWLRGHHFILLEVFPLQYNPLTSEIKIMKECEITLHFTNYHLTSTVENMRKYYSQSFEELFENLFINHDYFKNMVGEGKPSEGYLIIVYDTFYDEILPLANWKANHGFVVTVTNTSQIPGGATTTNIRNYISNAYYNWSPPPSYVLLVGDTAQIPTFTGTTGSSPGQAVDLYFVTVNGTDYFPDIHIGRFPAANESQVVAMVNKTIYYEAGNFPSNEWIKKAAFMASEDNYQISEGTHNYVINNYLLPHNYTCDKLYCHTYGATTQQVINALNNGRSLAIYSGHGSSTSWADGPPLSQSQVRNLTNNGMYPFVCSHACLTGTFNNAECFGETWLREANKAGLAFWGASSYTYWDEDDILEKRMFKAWWEDNLETIGGMTDKAKIYLYQYYGGGGLSKYYFEVYNVLGDASVKIWREEPILNITHNFSLVNPWNLITIPVLANLTAKSLIENISA
ncbi:MAG: C25 family cysteine peptidase, partial [Candidatus Thermoplasmatota archaeon]